MSYPENKLIDDFITRASAEEVIEPNLPIVDAHHHLWDSRAMDYEPYSSLDQKVFLCDSFSDDINSSGHNVIKTVYVQGGVYYRADGPKHMRYVGETEFAQGIAAMSRSGVYGDVRLCAGIVTYAEFDDPNIEELLKAHIAASPNFRGIRCLLPEVLTDEFLTGFRKLGGLGLTYDNWSPDFGRMPTLAELANLNPDVPIIINHLGGKVDPSADDTTFNTWRSNIDTIAACPNTIMKLGGTQMRVLDWFPDYHMRNANAPLSSEEYCELMFPYYQVALDAFGPERCMFESNFPVDRSCIPYRTLWNMFKLIANKAGMSSNEKTDLFSGTASRIYRL